MADENIQTPNAENKPPVIPTENSEGKSTGTTSFYKEQLNQTKLQLEAIAKEREEYKLKLSQVEDEKLKSNNQWKELAEIKEQKLKEAEEKNNQFKSAYIQDKKMEVVKREAIKAGIRDEAIHDLDLVDLSMLEIETTSTGRINVLNVEKAIENLQSTRPYWFKSQNAPNINNSLPSVNKPAELTINDILKLQKTNPTAYNKAMQDYLSRRNK